MVTYLKDKKITRTRALSLYVLTIVLFTIAAFILLPYITTLSRRGYFIKKINSKKLPLGKAYIISNNRTHLEEAFKVALNCGFSPVKFEAIKPTADRFQSLDQMTDFCFQGTGLSFLKSGLSAGEVALVCSHRMIYDFIVEDNNIGENDWVMILEEDARIHPDAKNPSSMIETAISRNDDANGYGFIYLGLCAPKCRDKFLGAIVGNSCVGYCTHAYALTKRRARTFFEELYCSDGGLKISCGSLCSKTKWCQTDQSFKQHFSQNNKAYLVAPHLKSPDNPKHSGLLYQCCRSDLVKHSGTSLKSIDKILQLPSVLKTECFGIQFSGRLGNLMFEYASLVGICIKRGYPAETCASLSGNILDLNKIDVPTSDLVRTFNLSSPFCPVGSNNYQEHSNSSNAISFDPEVFKQPVETVLRGYLQSYKYFHPHAEQQIKKLYRFPSVVSDESLGFLNRVEHALPTRDNLIACVSVRRGDKVRLHNSGYNQWALSLNYYDKAIRLLRMKYKKLALVFFVGGGFNKKIKLEDREWVKTHLMANLSANNVPVHLEPYDMSHIVSMHAMSQCDALIVSSSSFSWWSGYLSRNTSTIIAPKTLHESSTWEFSESDYYPSNWILLGP
jgi:GR25 family glycosyltransferase involved in LPS biosynthesis